MKKLRYLWYVMWWKIFHYALWRLRQCASVSSSFRCANRIEWCSRFGPLELTVMHRDTSSPDGFSREELYNMLRTVRHHERQCGWRVPDEA